jgi:hypothetical protein
VLIKSLQQYNKMMVAIVIKIMQQQVQAQVLQRQVVHQQQVKAALPWWNKIGNFPYPIRYEAQV